MLTQPFGCDGEQYAGTESKVNRVVETTVSVPRVRVMNPVVAPVGTETVITKPLLLIIGATTPPANDTVTPLRSLPTIVIVLPTTPLVGAKAVIVIAFGRARACNGELSMKPRTNVHKKPNVKIGLPYIFLIAEIVFRCEE